MSTTRNTRRAPHKKDQAAQSPPVPSARARDRWLYLLLIGATLLAYQPAWHGGWLWDDDRHLTRPALQSLHGLWRIWSDIGATQQYYPVTHSAFWIQQTLWGHETFGYHLMNILLHAISACLIVRVLRKLTVPGAALAAMIFALHPVHVESVAWMTELKNTLSGVFFLTAALTYLHFDEHRSARAYTGALALFALALLSKTVTAPLPAVLLVVQWWKRGRVEFRRDVIPLAPFFVLGIVAGLSTAWLERTMIGAQGSDFQFSLVERCLIAGRVVWFYATTLVWPGSLIFNYPRWSVSQGVWWQYLYPLSVVAVAVLYWTLRSRTRAPFAALLIFGGLLFPVLGFINVYPFTFSFVADHFVYLASIPMIALGAGGVTVAVRRLQLGRSSVAVVTVVTAAVLGGLTNLHSRSFASADALYLDVLAHNPASWLAHNNLANRLISSQPEEALRHVNEAVRLKPDSPDVRNDRGTILQRNGRVDDAIAEYREAVRLRPDFATAYSNLCNALDTQSRYQEAVAACETAVTQNPDLPDAHYGLGIAMLGLGQAAAADQFAAALALRPDLAEAHYYLGGLLRMRGQLDDARLHLEAAIRLKPDLADAYFSLGRLLQERGRDADAIPQYEAALRLVPTSPQAHNNLGLALLKTGRRAEAISHFREALRSAPDYAEAQANLAAALGRSN